ncbi:MAG: stress response translation initiation inhibitor YciH [Candidatus Diapherotrites archaeon]|nr:stress response translation initiation inhibitor YciH [Candidatus Diapherotrites archaeon]
MEEICPKCGLPKNLCVCQEIAKEEMKIRVRVDRRRFGKVVTMISGFSEDIDKKELLKKMKRHFACGGTIQGDMIILQGDHRANIKEFLVKEGFKEESIDV